MKIALNFLAVAVLSLNQSFVKGQSASGKNHFSTSSKRPFLQMALPYHYDSIKVNSPFKYDRPVSASNEAYVRITYPVFQDNKLNDLIKSTILSPLGIEYQFKDSLAAAHPALSDVDAVNNGATQYREFAAGFLRQFEAEAPGEDVKAYWHADIQVKMFRESQNFLAIVCQKDYFTGGSHDLYSHRFLNFDKGNHRLITLQSQFNPDKLYQLKSIAERIFRKNEGLSPTDELDGYFFKNSKFSLPDDFTITGKGLMFSYGYYEIKPFAAGTTLLLIPFAEIKDLVLPGSILSQQMKMN